MKKNKKNAHGVTFYPDIMKNYGWRGGGLNLLTMMDTLYPKHHSQRRKKLQQGGGVGSTMAPGYTTHDTSHLDPEANYWEAGGVGFAEGAAGGVAGGPWAMLGMGLLNAGVNMYGEGQRADAEGDELARLDKLNLGSNINYNLDRRRAESQNAVPSGSFYGAMGGKVKMAKGGRIARSNGGPTDPPRSKSVYELGNPDAGQTYNAWDYAFGNLQSSDTLDQMPQGYLADPSVTPEYGSADILEFMNENSINRILRGASKYPTWLPNLAIGSMFDDEGIGFMDRAKMESPAWSTPSEAKYQMENPKTAAAIDIGRALLGKYAGVGIAQLSKKLGPKIAAKIANWAPDFKTGVENVGRMSYNRGVDALKHTDDIINANYLKKGATDATKEAYKTAKLGLKKSEVKSTTKKAAESVTSKADDVVDATKAKTVTEAEKLAYAEGAKKTAKSAVGTVPGTGIMFAPVPEEQGDAVVEGSMEFGRNLLGQGQILGRKFSDQYEQEYRDRIPKISRMKSRGIGRVSNRAMGGQAKVNMDNAGTKNLPGGAKLITGNSNRPDDKKGTIYTHNGPVDVSLTADEVVGTNAQGETAVVSNLQYPDMTGVSAAEQMTKALKNAGSEQEANMIEDYFVNQAMMLNPNPDQQARMGGRIARSNGGKFGRYENRMTRFEEKGAGFDPLINEYDNQYENMMFDKFGRDSNNPYWAGTGWYTGRKGSNTHDGAIDEFSRKELRQLGKLGRRTTRNISKRDKAYRKSDIYRDKLVEMQKAQTIPTPTPVANTNVDASAVSPTGTVNIQPNSLPSAPLDGSFSERVSEFTPGFGGTQGFGMNNIPNLTYPSMDNAQPIPSRVPIPKASPAASPAASSIVPPSFAGVTPSGPSRKVTGFNKFKGNAAQTFRGEYGGVNTANFIGAGISTGLNAYALAKRSKMKYPEATAAVYRPLDDRANFPLYDQAASNLTDRESMLNRAISDNTASGPALTSRMMQNRANTMKGTNQIMSQKMTNMNQIKNINASLRGRTNMFNAATTNRFARGAHQDEVNKLGNVTAFGQSAMDNYGPGGFSGSIAKQKEQEMALEAYKYMYGLQGSGSTPFALNQANMKYMKELLESMGIKPVTA